MDEGLTPFATAENAAHPGSDRAGLLTRLTARFNATMRATIVNDGRMIGLVLHDEYFRTIYLTAGGGGFTNLSTPICSPCRLPNCTSLTLVAGRAASTYLWADSTHLSSGAHTQLDRCAVDPRRKQPVLGEARRPAPRRSAARSPPIPPARRAPVARRSRSGG